MSKIEFGNPWSEGNNNFDRWFEDPYKVNENEFNDGISSKETEDLNWIKAYENEISNIEQESSHIINAIRNIRLAYLNKTKSPIPYSLVYATNIKIGNNFYESIAIKPRSNERFDELKSIKKITRSTNPFFGKYFDLSLGSVDIILRNKEDSDNIESFITGKEKNIYGKFSEGVTLNQKAYTFSQIVDNLENHRLKLFKEKKELSDVESLILDLPIIEWQLGWKYAASIMFRWINNERENINLSSTNANELLLSDEYFVSRLNEGINNIRNNKSVYGLERQRTELRNLRNAFNNINVNETVQIQNYPNYEENKANNWFCTESISIGIINALKLPYTDFIASIGSININFYFEGQATKISEDKAEILIDTITYRIQDGFDFIDDGFTSYFYSQPLGFWYNNVFSPQLPTKNPANNFLKSIIYLNNQDFVSFNENTDLGIPIYKKEGRDTNGFKTKSPYFWIGEESIKKITLHLDKENVYEVSYE